MRRTELVMGMPIIIDIPSAKSEKGFSSAFSRLKKIDEQFSPYKESSELNRYNRGEDPAGHEMQMIIDGCKKANDDTEGYFSANFGGKFNPTGYVKGWAIAEAAAVLRKNKVEIFCIFAGGDILAGGHKTWRVGIQDPMSPEQIVATIKLTNSAVATSGNYERGQHIINPKTKQPVDYWASVSVAGPDIIQADILATAAFTAGPKALELIDKQSGYEVLAIGKDAKAYLSDGFAKYLV